MVSNVSATCMTISTGVVIAIAIEYATRGRGNMMPGPRRGDTTNMKRDTTVVEVDTIILGKNKSIEGKEKPIVGVPIKMSMGILAGVVGHAIVADAEIVAGVGVRGVVGSSIVRRMLRRMERVVGKTILEGVYAAIGSASYACGDRGF